MRAAEKDRAEEEREQNKERKALDAKTKEAKPKGRPRKNEGDPADQPSKRKRKSKAPAEVDQDEGEGDAPAPRPKAKAKAKTGASAHQDPASRTIRRMSQSQTIPWWMRLSSCWFTTPKSPMIRRRMSHTSSTPRASAKFGPTSTGTDRQAESRSWKKGEKARSSTSAMPTPRLLSTSMCATR